MKSMISSNIRVDEIAWEKLKEIAKKNKRSMNKEIEYLIDSCIEEYEKINGEIKIYFDDED